MSLEHPDYYYSSASTLLLPTEYRGKKPTPPQFTNTTLPATPPQSTSTTLPAISVASRDGTAYYISAMASTGIRYALHGATTSTLIIAAATFPQANRVGLWFGELWAAGLGGLAVAAVGTPERLRHESKTARHGCAGRCCAGSK